jgi:site-specific recombinase XerD
MAYTTKIYVNYSDNESKQDFNLPALYTDKGLVISHLRYLAWFNNKSESWRERSIFSLKLLLDYINALPDISSATQALKSFTTALVAGTIDYKSLDDETELFWEPRKIRDANNILFHITHYTDFLALQDNYSSSRVNPFRDASSYEERLNWCAYYHKQANVFLNHLSNHNSARERSQKIRLIGAMPDSKVDTEKAIRFPENYFDKLINIGFQNNNEEPNYKLQAMTMLMHYGGLRKSEIFHIYVSDITQNPNHQDEALVRVYDPAYGTSPDPKYKMRSEYLLGETKFKARNKYRFSERLYSGWKSPLLTSQKGYFEVVFSPPSKAKEFLSIWVKYLKFQRVEPQANQFHPFAFTNNHGLPETIKNFQRYHKRAVEKIGLESKKENGTTEHGHRHAYGYRVRQLGLDRIEIQKAMHHKSPLSSLVYTQPSSDEIRNKMRESE